MSMEEQAIIKKFMLENKKLKKEIVELKKEISELNTDFLTKIDTRACGEKKMINIFDNTILSNYKNTAGMAILFMDIDHFKLTNDNYGHQFGDKVLQLFAQTLKENINETNGDILCRWGGDEFLILLNDVSHEESIEATKKIFQNVTKSNDIDYDISTSIGLMYINPVVFFKANAIHKTYPTFSSKMIIDKYVKASDMALYEAKKNGGNVIYDSLDNKIVKIDNHKKLLKSIDIK